MPAQIVVVHQAAVNRFIYQNEYNQANQQWLACAIDKYKLVTTERNQ